MVMTQEEFSKEIGWFLEYYNHTFNATQARIWFEQFQKFGKDKFHNALISHIDRSDNHNFPALGAIMYQLDSRRGASVI